MWGAKKQVDEKCRCEIETQGGDPLSPRFTWKNRILKIKPQIPLPVAIHIYCSHLNLPQNTVIVQWALCCLERLKRLAYACLRWGLKGMCGAGEKQCASHANLVTNSPQAKDSLSCKVEGHALFCLHTDGEWGRVSRHWKTLLRPPYCYIVVLKVWVTAVQALAL